MTTLSLNASLYRTEISSRHQIAGLRATHRDVASLTNRRLKLDKGDSDSFTVESFFYAFFKTPIDQVNITKGADTIHLTNVQGVLVFPFACTVALTIPSNSSNDITREAEVWFS